MSTGLVSFIYRHYRFICIYIHIYIYKYKYIYAYIYRTSSIKQQPVSQISSSQATNGLTSAHRDARRWWAASWYHHTIKLQWERGCGDVYIHIHIYIYTPKGHPKKNRPSQKEMNHLPTITLIFRVGAMYSHAQLTGNGNLSSQVVCFLRQTGTSHTPWRWLRHPGWNLEK